MKPFRFRLRTFLIFVAVLAPLLAFGVYCLQLGSSLEEMYGPEGLLESQQRFHAELSAGSSELERRRYPEAERHFQSALMLFRSSAGRRYIHDQVGDEATPSLGLANALAGQGRHHEAEPVYRRALEAHRNQWGGDHRGDLDEAKILGRHAENLRLMGRKTQANELEAQAEELRGMPGPGPER